VQGGHAPVDLVQKPPPGPFMWPGARHPSGYIPGPGPHPPARALAPPHPPPRTPGGPLSPLRGRPSPPRLAPPRGELLPLPGYLGRGLVQVVVVPLVIASIIRGIAANRVVEMVK